MSGFVARMPLRIRLVAATTLLLVLGLALSGVVAATTLRGYLVQRVDDQLAGASTRYDGPGFGPVPHGDGDLDRDGRPAPPSQFYIAYLDDTGAVQSVGNRPFDGGDDTPDLSGIDSAAVQRHEGRPFSVGAATGSSQWRVVAGALDDGSGSVVVAQSLADVERTVGRLELLELLIGVSVVLVLAGAGYVVVRRTLRPLTEVEHTAAAIAGGDLTRRVPAGDPRTEVGRLSAALNGMLHQIEQAFRVQQESESAARRSEEQMRQFVADASHELRTPLTSIRGFSELFRQGAVRDEEELRRVLRRIEDEAARMGVLVDDLLLLARLDQQRPLERRPVDLVVLASDAVEDARVVAPDRSIELVVDAASPVVVTGDDLRLRQVLGNLVGNALSHTPASSPVTVRVGDAVNGKREAVLEVRDEGPGMPPEEAARVFERFYRADASRNRGQGGTGLGLSIVAGLAAAHGGSVEVDTAVGAGATFRVRLPLASAEGCD
jgi:two-component system OmpR family sensor kinase